MRAIRFDGTAARFQLDARDAVPAPGEALVRPRRMGICSTDLEIIRGSSRFVGTLGHEFVGTVVEVIPPKDNPHAPFALASAALAKSLKGKRVVADINVVCGKCEMCKAGLKSHCRNRTVIGCAGRDGCFADLIALPIGNLHVVPDKVDDDQAVFAEPLSSAAHVAQMLRPDSRQFVTVLGDGKIGLLCAQVVARINPSVRLLGKHPAKFGLCEKWGIKHRHIDEVGRRQDQDVVIDCTGSSSGLELAMQLVRPRGKIILKSTISPFPVLPGAPVPGANHPAWASALNLAPIVINEIELVGSRCGPIDVALGMLERGEVNVLPLITRRSKFEEALAALEAAKQGQIKVLLDAA
ncbi:MAG: alcohol dehydrogenase catalytic domain-containing protein [Phycisphaerales bacterium]